MHNVKKRNHEVPRGYLCNWLAKDGVAGLHYYDLSDYRRKFNKGRRASFAITDYLYVPEVSPGHRNQDLEDWFSEDEQGLAELARAAQSGRPQDMVNGKQVVKALRACIALGFRSTYEFAFVASIAEGHTDDQVQRGNCVNFEADVETINNFTQVYRTKFAQYLNWDFNVFYNLPDALLINDRPFFDGSMRRPVQESAMMPLGPNALMVVLPPPNKDRKELRVVWTPAPNQNDLVNMYNSFVIAMARSWIVASTADQLAGLEHELTPEKIAERRSKDTPRLAVARV